MSLKYIYFHNFEDLQFKQKNSNKFCEVCDFRWIIGQHIVHIQNRFAHICEEILEQVCQVFEQ
jgi:hypothetical protein